YPAAWLCAALEPRGILYCMRIDGVCGKVASDFLHSGRADAVVALRAPNRFDVADYELVRMPATVRLIRVVTPEGRIRVLATNRLDAHPYPVADFAALYNQRWRLEEVFRRLKHRLDLEAVTGLSWLSHQQDLGAKVLSDNLSALMCLEALAERDGQIDANAPTLLRSPSGALVKLNRTRAFAHLRQCLPRWLHECALPEAESLGRLLHHLAANIIHFVPDRIRDKPRKPKPHKAFAAKPVM
ncbi:MAG: transposase, partial [Burkholderia sp.]